jgi:PelA/Pel-15E family pectate lyase
MAGIPAASFGAVIGHMAPPEPVTDARILTLPAAQQAPWRDYLAHSRVLAAENEKTLAAERAAPATAAPADPPETHNGSASMPLKRAAAWYGSPEARHVADVIVSFQTPAGGWGKNTDRSGPLRLRGQSWVVGGRSFIGTIDNDATTTELRFLARVQAQAPGAQGQVYRDAFLKGVRYLLDAQYPNGGFPQVYPLEGGYHDAVTLNDDAMVSVAQVLTGIAGRQGDYGFVPPQVAQQARDAVAREIRLFVSAQVPVGGLRTAWGQQYDALTLAPAGARNFEPPALASHESATLLMYLMALPEPSSDAVAAVHTGAAWLRQAALRDIDWTTTTPEGGRQRVAKPGAGPIWSRYYDIATMKPVFGDRDRSIHDDVNELSLERRNGYGWYGTQPTQVLDTYANWARSHQPATSAVAQ